VSSRAALQALLSETVPHEIVAAADRARQDRFGLDTTVSLVSRLDPAGAWELCPVTGARDEFPSQLAEVPDRTTDLILLPRPGASLEDLAALWELLPERPAGGGFQPTVQLGTADTFIAATDAAGAADAAALSSFAGLQVVSDGIFPSAHPVRGGASLERWNRFWRGAAAAGMRGHATVLYGPGHGLDSVLAQLDAIKAVQSDTNVFLSVSPCIFAPERIADGDHQLTHASLDLRAWAACRLDETGVGHVSLRYDRSDLKSAHAAVRCGVDDLMGRVFLFDRDRKADSESSDLSVAEMQRWLGEVGMEMQVRNGVFDVVRPSEVLT
jgi:hypothetical protein